MYSSNLWKIAGFNPGTRSRAHYKTDYWYKKYLYRTNKTVIEKAYKQFISQEKTRGGIDIPQEINEQFNPQKWFFNEIKKHQIAAKKRNENMTILAAAKRAASGEAFMPFRERMKANAISGLNKQDRHLFMQLKGREAFDYRKFKYDKDTGVYYYDATRKLKNGEVRGHYVSVSFKNSPFSVVISTLTPDMPLKDSIKALFA